jgi:hypothetical protein
MGMKGAFTRKLAPGVRRAMPSQAGHSFSLSFRVVARSLAP